MKPVLSCALAAMAAATSAQAAKSVEAVEAVVRVQWPPATPTIFEAAPGASFRTPKPPAAPKPPVPVGPGATPSPAESPIPLPGRPATPQLEFAVVRGGWAAAEAATNGFRIDGGRVVTFLRGGKPLGGSPRVVDSFGDAAASVLAYDPGSGIAVLNAADGGDEAATLRLADSEAELGQRVRAVFEYRDRVPAVADGIVSTPPHYDPAMGAFVYRTTVPVSPGTAGAPLLNEAGEVVGVVKGMVSANGQGGAAVVVSGEHVRRLIAFADGGGTGERKPPRLGAALKAAEPDESNDGYRPRPGGALITQVVPGSAAEKAGLKAGERITAVGGTPVRRYEDVIGLVRRNAAGDEIELSVASADGLSRTVTATLGAAPSEIAEVSNVWVEIAQTPDRDAETKKLYDWLLKDKSLNESLTDGQRQLLRKRIESRVNPPAAPVEPRTPYRATLTPRSPAPPQDPGTAAPPGDADLRKTIEDLKRQVEALSERLDGGS